MTTTSCRWVSLKAALSSNPQHSVWHHEMKKRYRTTISLVLGAHIAIVVALFITRAAATRVSLPLRSLTMTVSLAATPPEPSMPLPSTQSDTRATHPQHTSITPSTNRVIRETALLEPVTRSADQIASELLSSLSYTSPDAPRLQNHDAEILRAAFHRAWTPPTRHEAGNAVVIARVIFQPDGTIRQTSIDSPSGIASFDSSVRSALHQVSSIAGLSEAALQNRDGVTFAFSVVK